MKIKMSKSKKAPLLAVAKPAATIPVVVQQGIETVPVRSAEHPAAQVRQADGSSGATGVSILCQAIEPVTPLLCEASATSNTALEVQSSQLAAAVEPELSPKPVNPAEPTSNEPPRYDFPLSPYEAPPRPRCVTRRRRPLRHIAMQAIGLVMVCALGTGGVVAWHGYQKMHSVFRGSETVAALSTEPVAPQLLKGEGSGRVNVLLLGIGGPGHEGADLTDTIMVASVDPVNHTAVLVSIPRDMWVKMPVNFYGERQKINAAYSSGKYKFLGRASTANTNHEAIEAGFAAVDQSIKEVTGLTMHYHVLVDFTAFEKAIDIVGGVTVQVPEALVDATMAWENRGNPVLAPAGAQQMDGRKALMYARSRETTSDFSRSERQRQVLLALKDKLLTAGTLSSPLKIDALLSAFGDNIYSDLSTQAAMRLVGIARHIDNNNVKSLGMTTPPGNVIVTDTVRDLSVVRPRLGFNDYSEIHAFIRTQLQDGYLLKEKAGVQIVTATKGFGENMAATLSSQGYAVLGHIQLTTEADELSNVHVVDLSGGTMPYTKHYLEQRYNTKVTTRLPSAVRGMVPAGAQFVILVDK